MKQFRRSWNKHARRRRPVNLLASLMTTVNLYLGIASIFASVGKEYDIAAYCILGGIIFDILDGVVARLTKSTSDFGKELDSLSDIVTFGVAPAVLVFVSYLPEVQPLAMSARAESIVGKTGSYMAIIYVICAALRLARYNTFQSGRHDSFTGLPSPAAGGTIASLVIFLHYFETSLLQTERGALAYYALGPMAVVLALLMVSTVRYPRNKLKAFVVSPRHAFRALGAFAFIIAIVHYAVTIHWSIVLFPMGMTYVLFGVVDAAYGRLTRRQPESREEKSGPVAPSQGDGASGPSPGSKKREVL